MLIRRLDKSNSRITQYKVYLVGFKRTILDDQGKIYHPFIGPLTEDLHKSWEIVKQACNNTYENFLTNEIQPKEEKTMLIIKKATLINNNDSDDLSVADIIRLIKEEENNITNLEVVKSESKAITKLKVQHEDNIKALIEVLDNK